jgi:AraC-like DNA-binding protein
MRMADVFADADAGSLARHEAAIELVAALCEHATPLPTRPVRPERAATPALSRAAEYLRDRCSEPVSLGDLCGASGLSASYLVRAFKAHYGLTPHAWQLNHRIQRGRMALRHGRPIAEVAHELGFADQAHLQRTFKRFVAATPGQYRQQGAIGR